MKTTFFNHTYTIEDLHVSPLQGQTYCIFDLEGTGILSDRESVTQFGAMLFNNRDQLHETFSTLSRAEKPIPQPVAQLTGITNEDMITAPSFIEAFHAFTDFIGDRVLVTQAGYEYDLPILRRHCELYGLPMFNNDVLDTKAMFTYIHPEITEVISTDFLIQYYSLDTEGIKRHDALADCTIIALIFERILEEYQALGLNHFTADPARSMKRFVIPEMYLNDN